MKALDIINKLAVRLPKYSDKFTTNFNITSLTRSGTTVTAVTDAAHGMAVGSQVNIVGAKTPLVISSLTRSGVVGTLTTVNNHDITAGSVSVVELDGSVEPEFNGAFTILGVDSRKTIRFSIVDAGPTVATGAPLLLNGFSAWQEYNGLYAVASTPTPTSFTYEIADATLFSPAAGTISARTAPCISGAVDAERLVEAYTAQSGGNYWAFVVLGDVAASKSRAIDSDAVDNLQRGNEYRQQLITPFSVVVFIPSSDTIMARQARDEAESVFTALSRSLLGVKFDSQLAVGAQNPVSFINHGFFAYTKAYYVHIYQFQAVADLTFNDTIGYDTDVAFRDISLSMTIDTNIDLATPPVFPLSLPFELGPVATREDSVDADINLDSTV